MIVITVRIEPTPIIENKSLLSSSSHPTIHDIDIDNPDEESHLSIISPSLSLPQSIPNNVSQQQRNNNDSASIIDAHLFTELPPTLPPFIPPPSQSTQSVPSSIILSQQHSTLIIDSDPSLVSHNNNSTQSVNHTQSSSQIDNTINVSSSFNHSLSLTQPLSNTPSPSPLSIINNNGSSNGGNDNGNDSAAR
jgi:hypothetical protein